jgi:DNA-binding MarR family transcriptional regulator
MTRSGASQLNWLNAGAVCLNFNLRRASRVVTQYYDEALKPTGVKVTQFTILMAIAARCEGTGGAVSRGRQEGMAASEGTGGAAGRSRQEGMAASEGTGGAAGRGRQEGMAASEGTGRAAGRSRQEGMAARRGRSVQNESSSGGSITDIARLAMVDRTTLTRSLRILADDKLIEIRKAQPGNKRRVVITAKGVKKMKEIYPYWFRAQRELVRQLTPVKTRALRRLLGDIKNSARRAMNESLSSEALHG